MYAFGAFGQTSGDTPSASAYPPPTALETAAVKKMQAYINHFATSAGFTPLVLTGSYDTATHEALKAAGSYAYDNYPIASTVPTEALADKIGPYGYSGFFAGVGRWTGLSELEFMFSYVSFRRWYTNHTGLDAPEIPGVTPNVGPILDTPVASSDKPSFFASIGTTGWLAIGLLGLFGVSAIIRTAK